jgi:hypothetical protein
VKTHKERLFLWLKAVLPEYRAEAFSTCDWSDGRLLSSLITYTTGMQHSTNQLPLLINLAQSTLGIPALLKPQDLDSSDGEFCLLIYLYFFAKRGSPGQLKLLEWLNSLHPACKDNPVLDFQQAWAPGHLVYQMIHQLIPRSIPSINTLTNFDTVLLIEKALTAAMQTFSISCTFPASALSLPTTDPLPLISFLSQLQTVKDIAKYSMPGSAVLLRKDVKSLYAVGSSVSIELDTSESPDIALEAVVESELPEEPQVQLRREEGPDKTITAFSFIPQHVGLFKIVITSEGNEIPDSPLTFDVYDFQQCQVIMPIQPSYCTGQPVELQVSSIKAGKGKLTASLASPVFFTGPNSSSTPSHDSLSQHCNTTLEVPAKRQQDDGSITIQDTGNSVHKLSFVPHEVGAHILSLYWNGKPIGEQIRLNVSSPNCTVEGEGLEKAFEGLESDFDIIAPYGGGDFLSVNITHQHGTCGGVGSRTRKARDGRYR